MFLQGRELIAAGQKNVWICHVGDRQNDGDFETFADMMVTSEAAVSWPPVDSLLHCLDSENCLAGDLLATVACLARCQGDTATCDT